MNTKAELFWLRNTENYKQKQFSVLCKNNFYETQIITPNIES